MILPILTYPNNFLRAATEPAVFPLSKDIIKLTKDMMDTVRGADGIGLAAPQVGKSVKLIVINLEKSGTPAFAMYNPRITWKGVKKSEIEEGCLSIPGVFGIVKRPLRVKIQYEDEKGETKEITDDSWISRVAQHEIDHINGKLIIDIIKKYTQGEEIVEKWRKQKI